MLIVHATRAFRDRVPAPAAADDDISTTTLGPWYATLLRRRPPLALLVNQATLLPLLTPLAPAATLLTRIPTAVADLLLAHHLPAQLIAAEHAAIAEVHLAPGTIRWPGPAPSLAGAAAPGRWSTGRPLPLVGPP